MKLRTILDKHILGALAFDRQQVGHRGTGTYDCKWCGHPHERVPEDLCIMATREYDLAGAALRDLGLE